MVASGVNAGNVSLPTAAGARGVIGVTQQNFDRNNYGPVILEGIVQCRFLTGTAINFGDPVKVADTSGRVTKSVPVPTGGANVRGVVGTALQSLIAGTPTDTLIDVLLQPGVITE